MQRDEIYGHEVVCVFAFAFAFAPVYSKFCIILVCVCVSFVKCHDKGTPVALAQKYEESERIKTFDAKIPAKH